MTRAYEIENKVFGGRFAKLMYHPYGLTVDQQQTIVDELSEWWTENRLWNFWSPQSLRDEHEQMALDRPITVRRVRGGSTSSWAYQKDRTISLSGDAGKALVCHEFAHIATPTDRGHGSDWRHAYVMAVSHVLGDYHAGRLRRAFEREYLHGQDRAVAKRRK